MANGAEAALGFLAMIKLPAMVVGGFGAAGAVLVAFGFGFSTPGTKWDEHAVEHVVINDTLQEIDSHMEAQQTLLEAIVRGECLENSVENLARQGLSVKCSELGIER